MLKTVKRRISSFSFSMNKLYRAITTAKPSNLLLPTVVVAFSVFLLAGGLYDLIQRPVAAIFYNNRFLFLNPYLSQQFISDSIIAAIIYSMGVIGLIAVYESTKYIYRPRQAYMLFLIGFVLVFMAYIFVQATIQMKLSGA
jgi:predicted neutral ceramidase superfamily lipid hydrolase